VFEVMSALAAGLVLAAAGPNDAREPIVYQVTPVVGPAGLDGVDVSMLFLGDRDGRTDVRLPARWAGADRLERTVSEVRIEGARMQHRRGTLRLRHRRGAPIRLTYRVRQDYAGPPHVGERPYRPSTLPDGFTLIGWTVFARVTGREHDPVSFRWGPSVGAWRYASDLDSRGGEATDFETLADSVLVGAPGLRLVERETGHGPVRIAVRGSWRFSPEDLADRFVTIGKAAADFWGDEGQPTFLALAPLAGPPAAPAQSGLGLGDGVAVWLTRDQDLDQASHVLIHEQLHAWMPARVGGVGAGRAEVLDFWFSEGFTDFYAYRMALRLGLITPEAYIAALDRALVLQARHPAGLTNAAVARRFFSDPAAAGFPYHQGLLLAFILDDRLRALSRGQADLDDVVLAMRSGQGPAPRRLIAAFGELGGGNIEADLHQHVDLGRPIRLWPGELGDCIEVMAGPDRQALAPGAGLSRAGRAACVALLSGL